MSIKKKRTKFILVKKHRVDQYLHILNKLIDGNSKPEEVTERWQKVKVLPK